MKCCFMYRANVLEQFGIIDAYISVVFTPCAKLADALIRQTPYAMLRMLEFITAQSVPQPPLPFQQ